MDPSADRTTVLQNAVAGSEEAFGEVVRIYAARLRWLVRLRMDPSLRARFSADDVLQETLLVASKRIREFVLRDEPAFWAWLCRIAEHRMIDLHRRHAECDRRTIHREIPITFDTSESERDFDPPAVDQSSPSERMRSVEQRESLERALAELAPSHRDVIVLRILEGQSVAETAALLGRTPGAISVLLHKAMKRLSLALAKQPASLHSSGAQS